MQGTLLTNDQIIFIFEKFALEEYLATLIIENEVASMKKTIEEVEKHPLNKFFTGSINPVSHLKDLLDRKINEYQNGDSDSAVSIRGIRSVMDSLELAYYAITGSDKQSVIEKNKSKDSIKRVINEIQGK